MNYGSVCSGIEAATVAWHPLGWRPAFFAEIDKFPSCLLAHHYPDVPNAGDFTGIQNGDYAAIDLLVGGTPCQAFSVAGLRAGLDDPRGNLTIEYARLAGRLRPRWLVWENVPGVLSIDGGRTFGTFLGMLGQLGYGVAYRVLDAQHFGVPQRRRRVFVVGHLGDWRRAAAVLFERHSLSGHPAPRREAREIAPCIPSRRTGGGGLGTDWDCDGGLVASTGDIAHCLNAGGMGRQDYESETLIATGGGNGNGSIFCAADSGSDGGADARARDHRYKRPRAGVGIDVTHSLRADGFDATEDGTGRGTPLVPVAFNNTGAGWWNETEAAATVRKGDDSGGGGARESTLVAFSCKDHGADAGDISPTLRSMGHAGSHPNAGGQVAVAFRASGQDGFTASAIAPPISATDGGGAGVPTVAMQMAVRRLTPRECERLQGFPDDHTKIGDKTADGPRYKALGNSMAVPVMGWIGERIAQVDAIACLARVS